MSTKMRSILLRRALHYGKINLDKKTWAEIKRSYHAVNTGTIAILVVFMFAFAINYINYTNLLTKYSHETTRPGTLQDGTIWYIQNDKHVIIPQDFGVNPADYKNGDRFTIFLDESYNVVDIEAKTKTDAIQNKSIGTIIGIIVIMIIVLISWVFISRVTVGKKWVRYYNWFCNGCQGANDVKGV